MTSSVMPVTEEILAGIRRLVSRIELLRSRNRRIESYHAKQTSTGEQPRERGNNCRFDDLRRARRETLLHRPSLPTHGKARS